MYRLREWRKIKGAEERRIKKSEWFRGKKVNE